MSVYTLNLDPDKTEVLLIRNEQQRSKYLFLFPGDLTGVKINPVKSAQILGVIFDTHFTFSSDISVLRGSCFLSYLGFAAHSFICKLGHCKNVLILCWLVTSIIPCCEDCRQGPCQTSVCPELTGSGCGEVPTIYSHCSVAMFTSLVASEIQNRLDKICLPTDKILWQKTTSLYEDYTNHITTILLIEIIQDDHSVCSQGQDQCKY